MRCDTPTHKDEEMSDKLARLQRGKIICHRDVGRSNLCPVGFGGCSVGTCFCAVSACKEGSRRGTFEKARCDSPSAKEGAAAAEYRLSADTIFQCL